MPKGRPLRLTEAQRADLQRWLDGPRTLAEKAAQMGISRRALYDYIRGRHQQTSGEFLPTDGKFHVEHSVIFY